MESLYVIHGVDEGNRFILQEDSVTIGRDPHNTIQLRDGEVSRKHAEIRFVDHVRTLIDLDSSNGVFVNGARIRQQPIINGDQIQIGSTLLLYTVSERKPLLPETDSSDVLSQDPLESDQPSHIIQSLSHDAGNPFFVMSMDRAKEADWLAKAKAHLNFVYHTTLVISHTLDIDRLLQRVMDMIFQWVSVDSGSILLWNTDEQRLIPKVFRNAKGKTNEVTISQTILDYVLKRHEGVLTSNAQHDQRWNPAASILQRGIREAICVPMQGRYGLVGVIYIDTSRNRFDLAGDLDDSESSLSKVTEDKTTGSFSSEEESDQTIIHSSNPDGKNDGTDDKESSLSALWLPGRKLTPDHLKLMSAIAHQTALAVEDTQYYLGMVQAERLAAIGQTVAVLSHHIKNILQGIRGGSYLIDLGLKEHDEELVRKGWGIVERNQTRISDLVLDMLTFSKERVPVMEFADINRVVSDVVELMQGRCTDGDVQLTWYPDETVPSFFFDPEQINRAIMNIVTNAIDAARDRVENEVDDAGEGSPETKGVVEVRTRYDDRSRTVQVLVDDNGSGVAPELKDILFRPFLSKNKSGGTGLGLAVTNKIIQEHQGRVDIDDSPLGGARFTVELPVLEKKPEES